MKTEQPLRFLRRPPAVPLGQPRGRPAAGRPRRLRVGHGAGRRLLLRELLARRRAHRLQLRPRRHPAGLDGRRRRRLAPAGHRPRRPRPLPPLVPGRLRDRLHRRPRRRDERAGLHRPARRHRPAPAHRRRQGDQPARPLDARRQGADARLQPPRPRRRWTPTSSARRTGRWSRALPRPAASGADRCRAATAAAPCSVARPAAATTTSSSSTCREATSMRLTPHEGPGSFPSGRFSPDGRTVYLSSNAGRDLAAFARVALGDDGRPGPIEVLAARDDAELAEFALDESGATAALVWNVAGRDELALLDLATARSTPGPALPAETAGGLRFSRDGRLLALRRLRLRGPLRRLGARAPLGPPPPGDPQPAPRRGPGAAGAAGAWCASRPTTGSRSAAGSTGPAGATAPGRWSSASTAVPRGRSGRCSTPPTRRCSRGASPSSRPTCAARRASASASSTSTTGRCESRPSRTSRTASPMSSRRASPTPSGSASWAARTAAT